ncbi:hypothetical protein L226DRAFT_38258 [Lentinus tigrinus ALCF2SS1-7]|uniref:uncharacterized protein n=1 Tax=Lentinus tigrinus ALCF2SS1-7 TaxID=1328758 RepID=UPI0011660276|nr:hypothetical protein L226DRAFT_38258 [Lentinus tigrinus ALCF2SS1-7]
MSEAHARSYLAYDHVTVCSGRFFYRLWKTRNRSASMHVSSSYHLLLWFASVSRVQNSPIYRLHTGLELRLLTAEKKLLVGKDSVISFGIVFQRIASTPKSLGAEPCESPSDPGDPTLCNFLPFCHIWIFSACLAGCLRAPPIPHMSLRITIMTTSDTTGARAGSFAGLGTLHSYVLGSLGLLRRNIAHTALRIA